MRIAIDAIPLLLRSAGVKTYVYNWLLHLRRLAGASNVVAFPWLGGTGAYSHEHSIAGAAGTLARLAWLHAVNSSALPLVDWCSPRVDVFHASHLLSNPPRRARLTATLYDMTCWVVPEMHSPRNVHAAKRFAERVLARTDGLIAISKSTRDDAVRILRLPAERIEVIYPGVADAFFRVTPEDVWSARETHGLARPYVLFVGTLEPRKNVDRLLDGWAMLSTPLREEYELVIAGPVGWAAAATRHRVRSGAGGARYLGYVPEADLPGITAGASVCVYPSLYEGFGLPLAQAMAAGVPAITSNVSSMPEVAGEAGLLVDPHSPSELAGAMERLLLSEGLRARLGASGARRAREFTWEGCARRSLEFFRSVCGD